MINPWGFFFLCVSCWLALLDWARTASDCLLASVSFCWCVFPLAHLQSVFPQQQQLQAQHLSHAAHGPVALPPHPSGLQPPGIPPVTGTGSGLLALGALGSQPHLPVKDEKNHHDLEHRGEGESKHYSWRRIREVVLQKLETSLIPFLCRSWSVM